MKITLVSKENNEYLLETGGERFRVLSSRVCSEGIRVLPENRGKIRPSLVFMVISYLSDKLPEKFNKIYYRNYIFKTGSSKEDFIKEVEKVNSRMDSENWIFIKLETPKLNKEEELKSGQAFGIKSPLKDEDCEIAIDTHFL